MQPTPHQQNLPDLCKNIVIARPKAAGFTIIELSITILLVAIIGLISVPSYQRLQTKILLERELTALKQGIAISQHLANISNEAITICASAVTKHGRDEELCGDEWSQGFIISRQVVLPAVPPVLPGKAKVRKLLWRHYNKNDKRLTIQFNYGNHITFQGNNLTPVPYGSFTFTDINNKVAPRKLIINRLGRVRQG